MLAAALSYFASIQAIIPGWSWLHDGSLMSGCLLRTFLFSLRENAIAKEPGSSYLKPWRCVSRLGLLIGGLDSLESSP
jgi:hypothetical protein